MAKICGMTRETAASLSVCVFYGAASLALGLLNKALLSSYNFNGIFFLLAAQMGLQLALCALTRDYFGNPFNVPKYEREVHRASLTVGVAYVANVVVGLVGLQMVNVPMFFCIRRLVSPTILLYEYLAYRKVADGNIQAAVGLIMLGTIIAGWDTLTTDLLGYSITFFNNICTAASSVAQKQFADTTKLGALGTLYYNSMTALPLSLALSLLFGEFQELSTFEHVASPRFWGSFAIALALGPILTYSSILCTTYNSPLAMSVTGNVKDVASTILGAVLFPGFVATAKSVGGLGLTFIGAGAYSFINLKKSQAAKGGVGGGGAGAVPSAAGSIVAGTPRPEITGAVATPRPDVSAATSSSSPLAAAPSPGLQLRASVAGAAGATPRDGIDMRERV